MGAAEKRDCHREERKKPEVGLYGPPALCSLSQLPKVGDLLEALFRE